MDFSFSSEDFDNYKLIKVYGNISLSIINDFEKFLRESVKKNNLILDMQNVRIITTSGMNILVNTGIEAKNNGKRIIILAPGSDLREMIDRMHNYEYFIISETIDQAKTKLKYYI